MIDRRGFVGRIALALLAAPFAVEAQQTKKIPRVGVLGGQSPESSPAILALRQGLSELGYVEGQNITIEWRWAHGKIERYADLAVELVKLKVDIIVAATTPAARAAQRATKTIPIVMAFVSDPVARGFVASLARPGGNVTGLGVPTPEIAGKRLQLLREVVPAGTRIAFLGEAGQAEISGVELRGLEAAARGTKVQLRVWEVRRSDELDGVFTAIARERAAGVVILPSGALYASRARIAQLAAKHRLPTSGWTRELPEAGCLMSYGANQADVARRAAAYVDKILKGAKPADLPVEEPTKFELVINVKTAKAIGLAIPPSLLGRADQVIDQ